MVIILILLLRMTKFDDFHFFSIYKKYFFRILFFENLEIYIFENRNIRNSSNLGIFNKILILRPISPKNI